MTSARPLPTDPQPASRIDQALALCGAARHREALDMAEPALAAAPDDVAWLNIAAACCRALKRAEDAEGYWRKALSIQPGWAELHHNLGILLAETGRHAEAETSHRQALALRPDYVEAHYRLGVLRQELKRHAEAEADYRRVLELRPDYAEVYSRLGVVLRELKRPAEAEASYRQALALRPDYPTVLGNLGSLLCDLKRYAEAEACYRRSLALQPATAEVHYNLGMLLHGRRRYAEAETCYRQALALRPGYVGAEWNLSLLLLLTGRFEEGWRRYETRYHPARHGGKAAVPALPFPPWRGQPLAGKSLVVWPEQGFGDAIQFCRYLALLKRRGAARITLVCKPPLKTLLATVDGVDAVADLSEAAALPPHDYWMLALSAPLYCGTTPDAIPAALPYLRPPPDRLDHWAPRLRALAGARVGLVWKGSATNGNDAQRSLPGLGTLAPLWRVSGVVFVSLQKGQGEDEAAAPPAGQSIVALGAELRDFADTAAILAQLDLLISVDTAIAHLAGALGKPCWVLLPAEGTDWRWQLERRDSPWYPGVMRLFRQAEAGGWASVVEEVALALERWCRSLPASGRPPVPPHSPGPVPAIPPAPGTDRAVALYGAARHREALDLAEQALAATPDNVDWLNIAAACCRALQLAEGAESYWRQALSVQPGYAEAHNNLGILLKEQKRYAEAEAHYRQAIALQPDYVEAHGNLGILLKEQRRDTEAEASYRRALAIRPAYPDAAWNLSLLLLRRGEYPQGWLHHESRYLPPRPDAKIVAPRLPYPPWQGQPLAGKSLVIWGEQGLGDEIQFCRYAAVFKRRGAARITLVCKPPLQALFQAMPEVDAVVGLPEAANLPPHDYWLLAHSAPLYCGTTIEDIPARLPYLRVPPARLEYWAPRLPVAGARVGLVWKGSPSHKNDAHRSLPHLRVLAPLWEVPGAVFVSLQKGQGEDEAAAPPEGQPLLNLGPEIRDFADSAAILAQLDLLICVDTAPAHLAGALDKPCWILLPAQETDWRWLLERRDSPWYPGAIRLFPQAAESEGWDAVVLEVAEELRRWLQGPPPRRHPPCDLDRLSARLAGLSREDFNLVRALVDRLAGDAPSHPLPEFPP